MGNLYTWGSNGSGRLGLGHRGGCGTPTCVAGLSSIAVRHVSMGRNHTAAITAGSDVLYMWGCASGGASVCEAAMPLPQARTASVSWRALTKQTVCAACCVCREQWRV
jgi:alpha-tubulin suppressor-like RCC1 family protein